MGWLLTGGGSGAAAPQTGENPQPVGSTTGHSAAGVAPSTQAQEIISAEVDVNLVRVPILVHDRKNQPILDLRAEEIVVKLQGRELKVGFLEPFAKERHSEPLPTVRLHLELPGGTERGLSSSVSESSHIVFFVDVENDQKLGKVQAASQLARFVTAELDSSYRAAVLSFNGEVQVELPFTSDHRDVARAIREAFERPPRPQLDLRGRVFRLIDLFDDCVVSRGAFVNQGDEECFKAGALDYAAELNLHSRDFLQALETLVRYVGGLEGRKSVVAVSHGSSMNPAPEVIEAMKAVLGNTEQLSFLNLELRTGEGLRLERNQLIDLALENEVTLHFVDRSQEPAGDTSARLGHAFEMGALPIHTAFTAPQWDLKEIAENTGGVFVANTDLFEGVKEVMSLEQGGYYLGFYTDHRLPLDQLSKVKVRTTRRGGRIVHRSGIYSRSKAEQLAHEIRGRVILGRHVRVGAPGDGRIRVPLELAVQPRDIGYEVVRGIAQTNFTLHFLVEDGNGRRLTDSYHFVNHAYPQELWEAGDVEPVIIVGWVELPVGEYRLTALVANPKLGNEGRITQALTVAPGPLQEKLTPAPDGTEP